jgi:tetratricopeptide (TPR) repeat protein
MPVMKKWIALAAVAAAACGGSQPDAKTPPPSNVKDVQSNGEIPPENLRGAAGGGDYDKGVAALGNGDVDGAKAIYDKMHERDPKDGTALVLLGLIDEKKGDKAGAEKAYKDAIKLRADLEAAYLNLSALLIDQKRADDALVVARAGLAKAPSSAGLHANIATILAGQGDQAGATGEFDQATRAAPDDPMLLVSYGHWLRVWKQGDPALAKLRAARPLAKDPGVLAAIGEEMKALGAFSDCVPTFDQAISIKDAPELRTYRAVCKLGAKDIDGAKADLKTAIDGQYAPAHFYLARVLSEAGDWKGAVAEYETFLKLEPNVPAARIAREKLKEAKEHSKK